MLVPNSAHAGRAGHAINAILTLGRSPSNWATYNAAIGDWLASLRAEGIDVNGLAIPPEKLAAAKALMKRSRIRERGMAREIALLGMV